MSASNAKDKQYPGGTYRPSGRSTSRLRRTSRDRSRHYAQGQRYTRTGDPSTPVTRQNPHNTADEHHGAPIRVRVDGDLFLPADPRLQPLRRDLLKALTFQNPQWQRKQERGLPLGDTPRYRSAYEKHEDGSIRIARGGWKILQQLARQHKVPLTWDAHTVHPEDRPASYHFNAQLRPYQEEAISALLQARSGVVVIPTGGGKTVVALGMAAALQTRTLFVVHTRELLYQTKKSAEHFLGIEAGEIGAGKWQIRPFTVALVQTLARRDLEELRDQFGLLIVDEAHHAPANTYCKVLSGLHARYRMALTATPYRKDGMHHLLWMQFGDIVYRIHKEDLEQHGRLMTPTIHPVPTSFQYDYQDDFTSMISSLCNNAQRHTLVIRTIQETHRPGGNSLVLTERVKHAKHLHHSLLEAELPAVLLIGKMSQQAREKALDQLKNGDAEILVATLALIGEGWDYPPLDTLYLTVPNGNKTKTTQALGRILRPYPGKAHPRVFDFLDINIGILRYHWTVRGRAYQMDSYEIQDALNRATKLQIQKHVYERPEAPSEDKMAMIRAISQGDFQAADDLLSQQTEEPPDEEPTSTLAPFGYSRRASNDRDEK